MTPAAAARSVTCGICDAPAAESCTTEGIPADHFERYVAAFQLGLLGRADLTALVASLDVIAPLVLVPAAEAASRAA